MSRTQANKTDYWALEKSVFSDGITGVAAHGCGAQQEAMMRMLVKWSAAAATVAALAGCATYPYGYSDYGYNRPYYGYDSGPYAYGPYYYGYPSYVPYYYGAPAVGLSFGFSGGGHHHH